MLDYLIPILLVVTSLIALKKGENGYQILIQGASQGFSLLRSIAPALILLLTAVSMLRSSGALAMVEGWFRPIMEALGIPPECVSLVLIRPISGSAALAVGSDLMIAYGVDSPIGRTAAVMLGSTETTFYTISVYFSAAGIEKSRYTLPAALFSDLVGFLVASLTARIFFP